MLRIFFTTLLVVAAHLHYAQEVLVPIELQPQKKQSQRAKKNNSAPLELPFFDDFSYRSQSPDPTKWADDNVYINDGYAKNAHSVGVATFDCLNAKGAIYGHLDYETNKVSDELTSKPINLVGKTDVWLSFLYQAGGMGPVPSVEDKLVLQFWDKDAENKAEETKGNWVDIQSFEGMPDDKVKNEEGHENFQKAFVQIEEKYLVENFQFRFVNYVSLGSADKPSERGNTDIWNIDNVFINDNRKDGENGFDDICFTSPTQSFLKDYESMPWKHYLNNPTELMKKELGVSIWNNGNTPKNINDLTFYIYDTWGDLDAGKIGAGSHDLSADDRLVQNFTNKSYLFNSSNQDSALFTIESVMKLDKTDFWESNNTIVYEQIFTDYYAYDDGSAESGYGIRGSGSENAQVAYAFENSKPGDRLWAVDVFFTRTLNAANLKYFLLVVWADDGGKPGRELYKQPLAETLKYQEGYNGFSHFRLHEQESELTDTSVVVQERFYVGWEQTLGGHLGIGLDRNRQAKDKLFYNTAGVWNQSGIDGALMFRPVFRSRDRGTLSVEKPKLENISFFPNPASDFIQVKLPVNADRFTLEVFDLKGKLRKTKQVTHGDQQLNISDLPEGMYIMRGRSDMRNVYSNKLIIKR